MKIHRTSFFLSALLLVSLTLPLAAQDEQTATEADSTGLPGDHFSLEGALELFKMAESPEAFEKALNSEDNSVNNLDLNEDGETDYIRVVDNMDGDVHAIVLQVPVSETESQDIAVIELEKTGSENAILQIIGDEDIYGDQTIAEPFEEEAVKSDGRGGPSGPAARVAVVVNVWGWPCVRYMYRPAYTVYVSPWRWRVYPTWWRPWRPHPWGFFHVRARPYRVHYHVVTTHRVVRAHRVYAPRRTHSTVVHTRTVTTKVNTRNGKAGVKKSTTTTTVRGKNGRVKAEKTTTTKSVRKGDATRTKTTTRTRGGRKRGG